MRLPWLLDRCVAESAVTDPPGGTAPMLRKRPLLSATMFGATFGLPAGARVNRAASRSPAAKEVAAADAAAEVNRIDALTKLKSLLDTGVLTREQYESERARLTGGI
jgi:Short C-terminal domain